MHQALVMIMVALLVGSALPACSAGGAVAPLEGSAWELVEPEADAQVIGRPITLVFEDGQVRGSSGCNTYRGAYHVRGAGIVIESLIATAMACPEPEGIMDREQEFLEFLAEVETYQVLEGKLQIREPGGKVMHFNRILPAE